MSSVAAASPPVGDMDDLSAQAFLNSMPSAAVVVDREGIVIAVNAAGEDLLGSTAAAARGKPVDGAFYVFLERARRVAPDEAVRFSHPFGASWFMVRSFPLRGADEKNVFHVLDAVDITAMKNAEFEVRESEQRLEEATRIAQLGTFKLQWDTGTMQWSPHVYTILGLAPDSFIYSFGRYRALVHPDDRESYDRLHEDLLDGKGIRGAEHRIIRPDGNVRWLRVEGRVLFDAEGLPYASFGTYQDITEAKQREQELKSLLRRNTLLYEALDASPVGVAVVTTEYGRPDIFYVNAEFERLTHYNTSSLSDLGMATLQPEGDAGRGWDRIPQTLAVSRGGAFELSCNQRGGHPFLARIEIAPVSDHPGRETNIFVLNLRDITGDRQRAEALLQSQKLEALGQLSGGVAHEINNLLQPMLALSDLGQDIADKDPVKVRKYFEVIASSGRKARDVVRQVLTFARRDAPQVAPYPIATLVAEALTLAHSGLSPGITLDDTLGAPDVMAIVNPTQVSQVVLNLITNAADAMNGEGRVTLRLETVDLDATAAGNLTLSAGTWIAFTVADHGCGMDAYTLSRIFEPFYTTKVAGKGTGLGLAVVYSIVAGWGGTLKVDSEVDKGTIAVVYIPTARGEKSLDAPNASNQLE